ncbi:MAG: META domain-containing protein [Humibacillus sp.]|nr:META domain-containing protein [Humibacillus sp.]MDN5778674.1 META domain-containing protein [Humibacillus sp.]
MADNPISGTSWVVRQVGADALRPPLPQLNFGNDGGLSGTTGVNRLMGRYEVGEAAVTFGPLATTRMAGPPELMAQEQAVIGVLSGKVAYAVVGDRLTLGADDHGLLLERDGIRRSGG